MTTTTESQLPAATVATRRWRVSRVLVAFVIGALLVTLAAVGTVLAYEQNYTGKVAAGVSIGGVDVAGLTRDEASAKLQTAFASIGTGTLTLNAPTGVTTLTYAQLGRRPDIDAMLDQAFAIGRTGNPVQRVVEEARTALNKVAVAPLVAIDRDVLAASIAKLAGTIDLTPTSAVVASSATGLIDTAAIWGRSVDQTAMVAAITAALAAPDAPATISTDLAVVPVSPAVTDTDAMIARSRANRMLSLRSF